MSQHEFLVYGRKVLEEIIKSGKTQKLLYDLGGH